MANGEWGDFVWGDGGSPPPFIASALHEESGFNKGMCSAKCRLNHMCCGNKVKARRNACFAGCNAQEIAYLAEAEAAVGGGNGGSGNGGGWDVELELDLAEAEAENKLLRSQLGGGNGNGNGKMGNMLIIGGIVVAVIVVVILLMKK